MSRLQEMRLKAKLSQSQLAEKTAVSLSTIQKWERGARDINRAAAEDVLRIADTLGCRIEDILETK